MAKAIRGKQAVPLGEFVLERRGLVPKAEALEEIKRLREKAGKAR